MLLVLVLLLLLLLFAGAGFAIHVLWWLAIAMLIVLVVSLVVRR